MKTLFSYALAVCGALAMLAGCSGGSGSPSSALGSTGLNAAQAVAHSRGQQHNGFMGLRAFTPHPDHHKSWRSPELKTNVSGNQLWISDFALGDVDVFSLPSLTPMGTVTGFDGPQGMCSDTSGDVWVTSTYTYQVLEYNHSAVQTNALTVPNEGWPVGCAWDKSTGNLAVTIIENDHGNTAGEIWVYPGGTGTPTAYTDPDPNVFSYFSAGYDGKGNLYFDAENYEFALTTVGRLAKNANAASSIAIGGGTIYSGGAVQWIPNGGGAGHPFLMVGDTECSGTYLPETSCVDYVTLSGAGRLTGTIAGTTNLDNSQGVAACYVGQAVRSGAKLYGADYESPPIYSSGEEFESCTSQYPASTPDTWTYPAGGLPLRTGTAFSSYSIPEGSAISKVSRQ
jgi:hypothetical protein